VVSLPMIIYGLELSYCSTCDDCNCWVLDAATDVANKFLGSPKFGGSFAPQKGARIKSCY